LRNSAAQLTKSPGAVMLQEISPVIAAFPTLRNTISGENLLRFGDLARARV
jgi:hypothetical protein